MGSPRSTNPWTATSVGSPDASVRATRVTGAAGPVGGTAAGRIGTGTADEGLNGSARKARRAAADAIGTRRWDMSLPWCCEEARLHRSEREQPTMLTEPGLFYHAFVPYVTRVTQFTCVTPESGGARDGHLTAERGRSGGPGPPDLPRSGLTTSASGASPTPSGREAPPADSGRSTRNPAGTPWSGSTCGLLRQTLVPRAYPPDLRRFPPTSASGASPTPSGREAPPADSGRSTRSSHSYLRQRPALPST